MGRTNTSTSKPKTWTIYAISIGDEIQYVGQTSQSLAARLRAHKRYRASNNGRTTHWSRHLDAAVARGARIEITALATANDLETALDLEQLWTMRLRDRGATLYNRCIGGKYADDSKARISAATKRQARVGGPGVGILKATPVIDLDTGETFESVSAAARAIGALQGSLSLALRNGWRCHGRRFQKLADMPAANDNAVALKAVN